MELRSPLIKTPVRAIVLDFDGTLSTLRHGWESVMKPLMLESIWGDPPFPEELTREVEAYIDASTGIQTIHQMKWLANRVAESRGEVPRDPWAYKAVYNQRLMEQVERRKEALRGGRASRSDFLIAGAEAFLQALRDRGVALYVASGTDHPDVLAEVEALGLRFYFDEVAGAQPHAEDCSKEAVLKRLLQERGLSGAELAVIGDGKVEIALGKAVGARTAGLASDEDRRQGVDPAKRARLIAAGADMIAGDFLDLTAWLHWLGLEKEAIR